MTLAAPGIPAPISIPIPIDLLAPSLVFAAVCLLARLGGALESAPIRTDAFLGGTGASGALAARFARKAAGLSAGVLLLFGLGYGLALGLAGGWAGIASVLGPLANPRLVGLLGPYAALFVVGFAVQAARGRLGLG